jgi:hypothetical protein
MAGNSNGYISDDLPEMVMEAEKNGFTMDDLACPRSPTVLDGPTCLSSPRNSGDPKTPPLKKPKPSEEPKAPKGKKRIAPTPVRIPGGRLDFGISAPRECLVCHVPESSSFRVMTHFSIFDICHHCSLHAVGVSFNHPKFIEIVVKRKELYEFQQRNIGDINKFAETVLAHEIDTLYHSYKFNL